jgi:dTDP-4-amino-4,6-dideoxygalactose transaminase
MSRERIPFVDLGAGVKPLRDEILAAITRVVDSAHYVGGPPVAAFEKDFARLCGTAHAVAVKTGTDALLLGLRALGVSPGDEVITAPNSFFASAEAIALAGATPVFADVDDRTLLIDPAAVARARTPRTRAIIPVHLYGQCADVDAIRAAAPGLPIIEDSCQAHGATHASRRAGSLGELAAFSFYPTKNLGALGEGGAITTNDPTIAASLRALRDHGQTEKHVHSVVGYNARLDSLQCAVLSVRLPHLEAAATARRALAAAYRQALAGVPHLRFVDEAPGNTHVYHLMIVRLAAGARERERVRAELTAAGIDTAIHYPTPIHLQPAFASLGLGAGSFPVTERAVGEILSLPMYPELPLAAVTRVAETLAKTLRA